MSGNLFLLIYKLSCEVEFLYFNVFLQKKFIKLLYVHLFCIGVLDYCVPQYPYCIFQFKFLYNAFEIKSWKKNLVLNHIGK